jgi:diguanylate cyclase (GGDEF)-like protein
MPVRRLRLSLLGQFSLLSLILIVSLGAVLATVLESQIERRALANAEQLAQVTAQVGVAPRLVTRDLMRPMSQLRLSQIDTELHQSGLDNVGLKRVKIFNSRGDLVYSDDRKLIGKNELSSNDLREALGGGLKSDVQRGTDDSGEGRQVLEVYTPLRLGAGPGVDGALEIYLSYDSVAAAAGREKRTLYLFLGIGLALLYAVLFRIVARASRRLRHLALHDGLTGLPNRTLFHERVERAIKTARPERPVAVLLVDLDRFKEVNDTLGHDHGDELLKVVAERLSGALREGDTLARLGGDEFAVVLKDLPHRGAAVETAGRLHDALRRPFDLHGIAVELDASVGVALSPEHGTDVTTLIQRADVAMYDAKRTQGRVQTYSTERDPYSPARLSLLGELRRAIEADELVLHYQPKISLACDVVTGVEALVRWQHPQHGLLQPDQFVPLAERTGTIAHLTRWVLDAALLQCAEWRLEYPDLTVAVNLAAANVLDVGLPAMVTELLDKHDLPGHALECEVSEHTVMTDPQRVTEVLAALRALGVRLALDDFGTGQASLAYLKQLPLDEVKIDRAFVTTMADDDGDAMIVRSTIDLARNLGLEVVAEGVESERVLESLVDLRCNSAQGFHLGRPLPAAELEFWLGNRSPAPRRAGTAITR